MDMQEKLKEYIAQFQSLNTNKRAGIDAPHKPILLLAIMDLVESRVINGTRIELTEQLERAFLRTWKRYVGSSLLFQPKIATPFWHMQNEPFYKLYTNDGKELAGSPYSVKKLRENTYAILDKDLFELMKDENSRAQLRVVLVSTYFQNQHITPDVLLSVLALLGTMINLAA
jgi:putative restriction endonuclease